MTPVKSIRAKCLDCCCDQAAEVRVCSIKSCALWPYRMGHRPRRTDTPPATAAQENAHVCAEKDSADAYRLQQARALIAEVTHG